MLRAVAGGVAGWSAAALVAASLSAMRAAHSSPERGFDLVAPLVRLFSPTTVADWLQWFGVVLFGLLVALAVAAASAARSGVKSAHNGE